MSQLRAASPAAAGNINRFIDYLISEFGLKNDAALARTLKVAPPVVSKLRTGKLSLGATLILFIHEELGVSVSDIRAISGVAPERRAAPTYQYSPKAPA